MFAYVTWASCIRTHKSKIQRPCIPCQPKRTILLFLNYHLPLFLTKRQIRPQHSVANKLCQLMSGHCPPAPPSSPFSLLLCSSPPCFPGSTHLSHPRAHVIAVLQTLSYPFLIICPMNFHLILLTSSPTFSISIISITSLLVILSSQHILSIRLRHLFWKTSILFSSLLFHVLQPFIKTGLPRVLNSLFLVRRLILVLQIFLNVINTTLALTTLLSMLCVPPPSLETLDPKYPNLSTSFIIKITYLYNTIFIAIQQCFTVIFKYLTNKN